MRKGGDVMVRNKDGGIIFAPLVEAYRQLSDLLIQENFVIVSKDELVDKLAMKREEIIEKHKKEHTTIILHIKSQQM